MPPARTLGRDERGVTAVEFALILPVLLMLMLGGMDLATQIYVRSILEGEMAKAGRDNSLESSTELTTQAAIDEQVRSRVRAVVHNATVTFTRTSFSSYARVQDRGEPFIDGNSDGVCNGGETYEDSNRNGSWDADSGVAGSGGANDAQLYVANVSYPGLFPLGALLGKGQTTTFSASTVLLNQPYADAAPIMTRTCA